MNAPVRTAAPVLLREDADGIAVLTLNRPDARNSLSEALDRRADRNAAQYRR